VSIRGTADGNSHWIKSLPPSLAQRVVSALPLSSHTSSSQLSLIRSCHYPRPAVHSSASSADNRGEASQTTKAVDGGRGIVWSRSACERRGIPGVVPTVYAACEETRGGKDDGVPFFEADPNKAGPSFDLDVDVSVLLLLKRTPATLKVLIDGVATVSDANGGEMGHRCQCLETGWSRIHCLRAYWFAKCNARALSCILYFLSICWTPR
jgi:hypothetical protein